MDLTDATTEAFLTLHHAHHGLNQTIKVSTAALTLLRKSIGGEDGPRILGQYVDASEEPWPKESSFPNPIALVDAAAVEITGMGIVQVFSAFDLFLTNTVAELSRWSDSQKAVDECWQLAKAEAEGAEDQEDESRIHDVCKRLDCNLHDLDPYYHVVRYFQVARNCFAHRDGIASRALSNYGVNPLLLNSLSKWKERNPSLPSLPKINAGEPIRFLPRHCILASDACRSMALAIDRCLVNALGADWIVRMAVFHVVLRGTLPARFELPGHEGLPEQVDAFVNFALANRYRCKNTSQYTLPTLNRLNLLKDARTAYEKIRIRTDK